MSKHRLLIADDHQMFRTAIVNLLQKEISIEVVGEASNGKEVVQLAAELIPDIILLDISLPLLNGVKAAQKIRALSPPSKILVLTSYEDEEYVINMIRAGAKGYILKDSPIDELLMAIKTIAKGNSYFTKEISDTIFALLNKADLGNSIKQRAKNMEITSRELEVLQYIAEEYTNKEIASMLFISPRTVETHRRNLIQKLRVKNTAGLVRYYFNNLNSGDSQRMMANG